MSTEHQQYSTENQSEVIRRYAAQHGMEIVTTYVDSGKSGLPLAGREELQKLLAEAESGHADFSVVPVYDVSRWGRFQDIDQSAYHEYVCRRAGVNVHYCTEQFQNDGSSISTLIKSVKRTMAGEYSRELSVKVFAGQCRLIELDIARAARLDTAYGDNWSPWMARRKNPCLAVNRRAFRPIG